MDQAPWRPHAEAMQAYFAGKTDAKIVVYDDFERDEVPIAYFFREPEAFPPLERQALNLCYGRVLDVGAGSGCHTLALQARGLAVVALDTLPELVDIMSKRGVKNARCASIFDFSGPPFDTVLMMMNGLGIAETLAGLRRLLGHVRHLVTPNGQLLADSTDLRPRQADGQPDWTATLRPDGRYIGELHFQLEYEGRKGPPFQQLYVDPDQLTDITHELGWTCELIFQPESPGYLARLTPGG